MENQEKTHPDSTIFYRCNPSKNKKCKRAACYIHPTAREDYGVCRWTYDKSCSADGKEYYYDEQTHKVKEKR